MALFIYEINGGHPKRFACGEAFSNFNANKINLGSYSAARCAAVATKPQNFFEWKFLDTEVSVLTPYKTHF